MGTKTKICVNFRENELNFRDNEVEKFVKNTLKFAKNVDEYCGVSTKVTAFLLQNNTSKFLELKTFKTRKTTILSP